MTQMQQPPVFNDNPKAQRAAQKAYDKANRPAWKKKRVIIPVALVAIAAFSAAGSGGSDEPTEITTASAEAPKAPAAEAPAAKPAEPAITVSAEELIAALEGNALKAKNTYDGKQVVVTGFVGSIDASGDYFALLPEPDAMIFTGVQVQTSEKFMDQVSNFTQGQPVTVTGEITNVGEVMGYSLEAESIK